MTEFRTGAPLHQHLHTDTVEALTRDLDTAIRQASTPAEREELVGMRRFVTFATAPRESGIHRAACTCQQTPSAVARRAASPIPAPSNDALNGRFRQQTPSAAPSAPASQQSLLARMRAAILPAGRTAPKSRVAGTGVPQPPSLNDRIKNGVR